MDETGAPGKGTGPPDKQARTDPAGVPAPRSAQDPGTRPTTAAASWPRSAASRKKARGFAIRTLIGATVATVISIIFISSFIGALHAPGPRSVPLGIVGTPAQASALHASLGNVAPGGYTVTSYPTQQAASSAILDRGIDAALVPGPGQQLLLVATATSPAATNATISNVGTATSAAGTLTTQDIRPLPANDPDGLSRVFFVTALLVPSLLFASMLITRFGKNMHPIGHILAIAVYAAIIAAFAVIFADPVIGALTGAPWALFGIGMLLAFAVGASVAAATRWAGELGYIILFLLFIPVGIASSGTVLGPNMITQWYADLGKALPAGSAMPAIQNAIYFNGNAITTPLLILSAWALAGAIALGLVAVFHPRVPGRQSPQPDQPPSTPAPGQPSPHGAGTRP
jgi:hypothetical protein